MRAGDKIAEKLGGGDTANYINYTLIDGYCKHLFNEYVKNNVLLPLLEIYGGKGMGEKRAEKAVEIIKSKIDVLPGEAKIEFRRNTYKNNWHIYITLTRGQRTVTFSGALDFINNQIDYYDGAKALVKKPEQEIYQDYLRYCQRRYYGEKLYKILEDNIKGFDLLAFNSYSSMENEYVILCSKYATGRNDLEKIFCELYENKVCIEMNFQEIKA